ncbi:ESX-1 secretion-associated protein EspI-like [Leptopilina heterotoma]|uniref:ESX-1 secretion-associated protein EspI-like n=1 Tax=Leptopilina heterotoma TaxID=63436 RepID=UPI001CAA346C|nr:ESX-1 secretion-associated protein EspI-like [Leptopilina heterotoma]
MSGNNNGPRGNENIQALPAMASIVLPPGYCIQPPGEEDNMPPPHQPGHHEQPVIVEAGPPIHQAPGAGACRCIYCMDEMPVPPAVPFHQALYMPQPPTAALPVAAPMMSTPMMPAPMMPAPMMTAPMMTAPMTAAMGIISTPEGNNVLFSGQGGRRLGDEIWTPIR